MSRLSHLLLRLLNHLLLLRLLRHRVDGLGHHWISKLVLSLVLIRDEALLILSLNVLDELILWMTPSVDDIHVWLSLHEIRLITLIFWV